jgi:hypothetical protein
LLIKFKYEATVDIFLTCRFMENKYKCKTSRIDRSWMICLIWVKPVQLPRKYSTLKFIKLFKIISCHNNVLDNEKTIHLKHTFIFSTAKYRWKEIPRQKIQQRSETLDNTSLFWGKVAKASIQFFISSKSFIFWYFRGQK